MQAERGRELESIFGDDFAVERELGRGGMGAVYLVRNRATNQRFAVKTPQLRDPRDRKRFTHELQHWLGLPEHPNLVTYRFSRTQGNRVLIFVEYVSGGSLGRWIAAGRLQSIADVLDVAIQLARGLHALHSLGLVHQDIKPENALVTEDGFVKVTDFGLARARSAVDGSGVIVAGMTPAYRSPEQVARGRVDARTDQWSWALTVLAILNGGATWRVGEAGRDALEDYLSEPAFDGGRALPRMPPGLVKVLARALEHDPADRWPSMQVAARQLENVYRTIMGTAYAPGRLAGRANRDASAEAGMHTSSGDPTSLFASHAISLDGSSGYGTALDETSTWFPDDGDMTDGQLGQSPAARAARDAHHYGEIQRRAQARFDEGDRDATLCSTLLDACERAGDAHHLMGDLRAAVESYEQAIAVYTELIGHNSLHERVTAFVNVLRKCSLVWGELHQYPSALLLLDRARKLIEYAEVVPLAGLVAAAEGKILSKAGRASGAEQAFKRAVLLMERYVTSPGVRGELAQIYIDNGVALHEADLWGALRAFDKAIELLEGLEALGSPSSREQLAEALLRKAVAYSARGYAESAIQLLTRSIHIREQLVQVQKFVPAMIGLGASYAHMRDVVEGHQSPAEALKWGNRAVETLDEVVHKYGRNENLDRLAYACIRKGEIEIRLNLPPSADLERGRRLVEHLVKEKGRVDLEPFVEFANRLCREEYRQRRQKWLAPNPLPMPDTRQQIAFEIEQTGPLADDPRDIVEKLGFPHVPAQVLKPAPPGDDTRDNLLPPPPRTELVSDDDETVGSPDDGPPDSFPPALPPAPSLIVRPVGTIHLGDETAAGAFGDTARRSWDDTPLHDSTEPPEPAIPRRSIMPPLRRITLAPGRVSIARERPSYADLPVPRRGQRVLGCFMRLLVVLAPTSSLILWVLQDSPTAAVCLFVTGLILFWACKRLWYHWYHV